MRLLTLLLGVALVAVPAAQDATKPAIDAEISRARARLEASASETERRAMIARLDRARTALEAGRAYLAAYLLEAGWEGAKNYTFVKASADITTQEAFARKWETMGEPKPQGRSPRVPALVDAIAAVAEARGATTYHASLPYGQDSGISSGLYFLADSQTVMQFAAMVRGLPWPAAGTRPAFRSLAGELTAFDAELTTAYERMEKANHPTYISASAALKQARTLNDRGHYAGALFEYLLSRYLFAPLRGPAAAEATAPRIAATRTGLAANTDHTIAEMFLQLAEEQLAGGTDTQRRSAAAVLEDVLPAYAAAIAPSTMTTAAPANSAVTITLVRWPFT